jgi:hypothetical protein
MATYGAILLLSWLKQRKGSNSHLALVSEQHSPAVLYHLVTHLVEEVKDFRDEQRYLSARLSELQEETRESSRVNRVYHTAHERKLAEREDAERRRYRMNKRRQVETLVTIAEINERIPAKRESA